MSLIPGSLLHRLEGIAAQRATGSESGHDILHVRRVARNARSISEAENVDPSISVASALLHELFNYPKDHPDKARSGEICARFAANVLRGEGLPDEQIEAVAYAISVHPFSLGIVPTTADARILQDADRLDALGAAGIARVFSTGNSLGRPFYADDDPFCIDRAPDDSAYTIDHFYRKLLNLPATMHTATGQHLAEQRVTFMRDFLGQLRGEIGPSPPLAQLVVRAEGRGEGHDFLRS